MINSIENREFSELVFIDKPNTLLICTSGYEQRSTHIYNKLKDSVSSVLMFQFEDCVQVIDDSDRCSVINVEYNSWDIVVKSVLAKVSEINQVSENRTEIHIDYSSMPRKWYCNLFLLLSKELPSFQHIYFWYSSGDYINANELYPSAGVENISLFSGKASINTKKTRAHIIGCGYDYVRTNAITSIVDPSKLVICYSCPTNNSSIRDRILKENKETISNAMFSFELPLDKFSYLLMKLYETSVELLEDGDVVIIPDGPKPMILASSIIPSLIREKSGITCLHVSRHDRFYKKVDVIANGHIYGFSMK